MLPKRRQFFLLQRLNRNPSFKNNSQNGINGVPCHVRPLFKGDAAGRASSCAKTTRELVQIRKHKKTCSVRKWMKGMPLVSCRHVAKRKFAAWCMTSTGMVPNGLTFTSILVRCVVAFRVDDPTVK
jgi:hypothetical protein